MHFFRTLLLLAALLPVLSVAQTPKQARRIETATQGTMRLISEDASSQIIAAKGEGSRLIANPEDAASVSTLVTSWLTAHAAELFQLTPNAELREYQMQRVGKLWHSSYELRYNDIPVRERTVKVNTGALTGAIIMIRSNVTPSLPNASTPQISSESVSAAASREIVGIPQQIGEASLVYVERGNTLMLAWEVVAGSPQQERWRLTYDALTGALIEKKSMLLDRCFEGAGEEAHYTPIVQSKKPVQAPQASGTGRVTAMVHLNTPTDDLTEVGLPGMDITVNGVATRTDSLGYWTLPTVTFPLTIETGLQNPYLNVRVEGAAISTTTASITSGSANIRWDDDNSAPSERDAMYSLLRTRAHIKSIQPNLKNIDQLLRAYVDYQATCNAYYDPAERSFTFFTVSSTCNPTAQVSDVVYHEYGHRVNHCRYVDTDIKNMVDMSLNEGFADIYSALMRDDPRIGIGFFTNPTRVLRNCENTRKWPTHIDPDPHINGLIVAGAYWDLRKATDLPTAQYLFHTMGQLVPDGNGAIDAASLRTAFTNVLVATILADDDDNDLSNGTPHLNTIIDCFKKHNITLAALLTLAPEQLNDQPVTAASYPVTVEASYTGPVGVLDESSVTLHYSLNGNAYTPLQLQKSVGTTYVGAIDRVPAGSIVTYYATAKSTLGDENETPFKEEPLKFLVGFEQKFSDDFETNKDWIKDDSASSGRWERGDPYGTAFPGAETYRVQQDTDHSIFGTQCYVTGNANTSSPSYDDVDNGVTRLTSPVLDLSSMNDPFIRYWYYYSNDMGQNPGQSRFVVELSEDGNTWYEGTSTNVATDGWQQALIRVRDIVSLSDKVQIRFVASDLIGSLVEAGVDDFEILDPAESKDVAVDIELPLNSLLNVFPQPVTGNDVRVHYTGKPQVATLLVRDLLGNEILRTTPTSSYELKLALPKSLTNGIYILQAITEEGILTTKVVVAR